MSCEPWATRRRRGRVATEEPHRNFQAGYRADLWTLGEKNESKGGGKWNTGVVIGAGETCDGSGVAGDRQHLVAHWSVVVSSRFTAMCHTCPNPE